jgi:hypothetical protein
MSLRPGRLKRLVDDNLRTGSLLICHKTTYDQHPELGETVCRGFFDAYGPETQVVQVMERLLGADWYEEVEPPTSGE